MDHRQFRYLPLSIRIGTVGGLGTPLVLRGTPLPATRSEVFSTAEDNQTTVEVSLSMGERPLARDNIAIGKFVMKGIPPAKAAVPQIKVTFEVNQQCGVTVRAEVASSDLKAEQRFEPPAEMSDEKIQQLLHEAQTTKEQDDLRLQHIEAVNRANSLVSRAEERLKLGPNSKLSEAVAALGLSLQTDDSTAIREKSDTVDRLISPRSDVLASDVLSSFFTPVSKSSKPRTAKATRRTTPAFTAVSALHQSTTPLGKIFGGGIFTLDPQLCFVLMPFADKYQPIYDDYIRPTVEATGMRCQRADDVPAVTLITWDIWERINRARFLIAELTDQNPNVFYELGLAHALSKDVILITQSMDFVPFDLKAVRCIVYEFTPRGIAKLTKGLKNTIEALIKVG